MGKFLRSLTDGSLRCKYCGDNDCSCLEDGYTVLSFITIWHTTDLAINIQLKQQILVNGKKIPSGHRVWIRKKDVGGIDELLKKITVTNDMVNRLRFD